MKIDSKRFKDKGWSEEEIQHAREVFDEAENKKHPHMKFLEKATYWFLFIIIAGGTLATTWVLEPLLIVATKTQAMISFLIVGALFGTLASFIVKDIEHIQTHHHILLTGVIPVVAVAASVRIVNEVNMLTEVFQNMANHNPYILAAVFAVAALIPYFINTLYNKKRRENETQ